MDRIAFLESISGIEYPEMIVEFFDQFIALKYLVEDYGQISVQEKSTNGISFVIKFTDVKYRDKALSNVQTSSVVIYGKPISINLEIVSETEIKFTLHEVIKWDSSLGYPIFNIIYIRLILVERR